MMDGFDLDSQLVCEGIIGDGCGGGRIFFVEKEALLVYDPTTKKSRKILEGLQEVQSISKKGCIITLELQSETRLFDLSSL